MGSMDGRHVVVTGGTGALGTAVVAWMLERGATCHVPCLHEAELRRFPFTHHERVRVAMGVELTDEAKVVSFYQGAGQAAAGEGVGTLWASVHIAGGFAYTPIETVSKDAFVSMMQMNALTCFLCSREAAKLMANGGRIVNVAARPALEPRIGANMVPYTASKAAVAAMTEALGEELVARGVLVNAVAPSIMDTPANRASMPTADFAKWAKVEDVARTIGFLASPDNTCTRSAVVPVYGGA